MLVLLVSGCGTGKDEQAKVDLTIQTRYGDMGVVLYETTPLHRQRILELCAIGFYDSLLVNQLLADKVIEISVFGLDSALRAESVKVKAEIEEGRPAKKGALVAYHKEPMKNPSLESSVNRFFLVIGSQYTDYMLDTKEPNMDEAQLEIFIMQYLERPENKWINEFAKNMSTFPPERRDSLVKILTEVRSRAIREWASVHSPHRFTRDARAIYRTVGGLPEMEGTFSIIGEVTVGLETIDKINQELNYQNFDSDIEARKFSFRCE